MASYDIKKFKENGRKPANDETIEQEGYNDYTYAALSMAVDERTRNEYQNETVLEAPTIEQLGSGTVSISVQPGGFAETVKNNDKDNDQEK